MTQTDRKTGSARRVRSWIPSAMLAAALAVVGLGTPAHALSGSHTGCPGSPVVVPYRVERLSTGYTAYFPQRRVDRSPCYAGRQIIRVRYREFTGFPNATSWSLQETGPGRNTHAAWYVGVNQYLNVPVWEGGHYTKDIVSVDVLIEWFTDSWHPLGSMYLDHDATSDYQCLWGGYCTIHSSPQVGAYVYYR